MNQYIYYMSDSSTHQVQRLREDLGGLGLARGAGSGDDFRIESHGTLQFCHVLSIFLWDYYGLLWINGD